MEGSPAGADGRDRHLPMRVDAVLQTEALQKLLSREGAYEEEEDATRRSVPSRPKPDRCVTYHILHPVVVVPVCGGGIDSQVDFSDRPTGMLPPDPPSSSMRIDSPRAYHISSQLS